MIAMEKILCYSPQEEGGTASLGRGSHGEAPGSSGGTEMGATGGPEPLLEFQREGTGSGVISEGSRGYSRSAGTWVVRAGG